MGSRVSPWHQERYDDLQTGFCRQSRETVKTGNKWIKGSMFTSFNSLPDARDPRVFHGSCYQSVYGFISDIFDGWNGVICGRIGLY